MSAPPPSGGTQWMFCRGSLMSQVLQWTQFCALICSRRVGSNAVNRVARIASPLLPLSPS